MEADHIVHIQTDGLPVVISTYCMTFALPVPVAPYLFTEVLLGENFTLCENSKLHNTPKMFPIWFLSLPFYGDRLCPESNVTVQIKHTVSSQDFSQRMYRSFY